MPELHFKSITRSTKFLKIFKLQVYLEFEGILAKKYDHLQILIESVVTGDTHVYKV